MLRAKRLSENWTVGREVKLLGQLYNRVGNLLAKGIIICSTHASQAVVYFIYDHPNDIKERNFCTERQQPVVVRCDCR